MKIKAEKLKKIDPFIAQQDNDIRTTLRTKEENEDNQSIDQTVIDTPRCKANNCFISIDFRVFFIK